MTSRLILVLILGLDALILLLQASSLSLTYHGAKLLYETNGLLSWILHGSMAIFGHNDLALRLPLITLTLVNAILLYALAEPYAKTDRDRLWLVAVFLALPGIISSALLVNSAALVIFLLLVFLLLRRRFGVNSDWFLVLYAFADAAFYVLFFAFMVYHAMHKKWALSGLMAILVVFSFFWHGYDTGGVPQGRFLDTLAIYAGIFSPIIFIYLFYVLYRRWVTGQTDLIWYMATTSLVFSLLLAFRQHIALDTFGPFLMPALLLGMQTFAHSYRIRLRPFRKRYRILFSLTLFILVLNVVTVLFNKQFYRWLDDPSRHFAYRAQIVKELAEALKQQNIQCVDTVDDRSLQLRLRFYGIHYCPEHRLEDVDSRQASTVTIRYEGVDVAAFDVSNIPR